jgi:hypothetical protein
MKTTIQNPGQLAAVNSEIILSQMFALEAKGEAKKNISRTIEYDYIAKNGQSLQLKIKQHEWLDTKDADLFYTIAALVLDAKRAQKHKKISPESTSDVALSARSALKGYSLKKRMFGIEIRRDELVELLGKQCSKNNYKWLAKSLERLGDTTLNYNILLPDGNGGLYPDLLDKYSLLFYRYLPESKSYLLMLDPKISEIINKMGRGEKDREAHTLMSIRERMILPTNIAKDLYTYLCNRCRQGQVITIYEDTLIRIVFHKDEIKETFDINNVEKTVRSKQRRKICDAMDAIKKAKTCFSIERIEDKASNLIKYQIKRTNRHKIVLEQPQ